MSHQTSHDFLRYEDLLLTECRAYSAITVATVIEVEDVSDDATHASILVSDKQSCAMVKVGTAGKTQYGEQFWQCIDLPQGINQRRLLPIAQEPRVDAQAFF